MKEEVEIKKVGKNLLESGLKHSIRVWTKTAAEDYIQKVEKGKEPMGLKYWSTKDFLKNHKTLNRIISV